MTKEENAVICTSCRRPYGDHEKWFKGRDGVMAFCDNFESEMDFPVPIRPYYEKLLTRGKIDTVKLNQLIENYETRGEALSIIICHITDWKLSKPDYDPKMICSIADDWCNDAIKREDEMCFEDLALSAPPGTPNEWLELVGERFGIDRDFVQKTIKESK